MIVPKRVPGVGLIPFMAAVAIVSAFRLAVWVGLIWFAVWVLQRLGVL